MKSEPEYTYIPHDKFSLWFTAIKLGESVSLHVQFACFLTHNDVVMSGPISDTMILFYYDP
jgi:hypothetical protein